MPKFGKQSQDRLATCHPKIQLIMNEAIKTYDFTVLCGTRTPEEQYELYKKGRELQADGTWKKTGATVTNIDGRTKKSEHNYSPSHAIDIAPYPIDWNNIARFTELSKVVKQCAKNLGIKIEYGGDWTSLKDYPHYQLDKSEL